MTNVVIDGDVVTHRREGLSLVYWLSVTRCRIWFVEREHPLEIEGAVPTGDPRSHRVDDPVDCMTCLVVEASL